MPKKPSRSDSRTFKGRTLDVSLREDPRNGQYRMQAKFGAGVELPLHSKTWLIPVENRLDQGSEGACVGFAGAHCYGAEPLWQYITVKLARMFYKGAQKSDEWPGENYEGTSVNGLMKFLKLKGWVAEYRWINTLDELKRTLCFYGPVISGSVWKEGCFYPDAHGFINFEGKTEGGHAICICGIDVEEEYFLIQQSWGLDHGTKGQVKMRFVDMGQLIGTRPQICYPQKRAIYSLKAKAWWQFWK